MSSLDGKRVIVTGSAKGIGRAEAELLAKSGAQVVFTDIDDENGTGAASPYGDRALFIHHDVSRAEDWVRVIAATKERFGGLDGLVNNAGIYLPASLAETTEEIFDRQIAVNQKGTFLGLQHASEAMKAEG